jgi:murein DD-endopeptidase MepM/ murein hydrolase activator NlpD
VYVIEPGDTLALIARRHGVTAEEVAKLNHLANPNLIYVGQRLLLPIAEETSEPSVGGQVHVVQGGETLARVAARYGTTVWAVAQANGLSNPNVLQAGQRLLIPTGERQSSLPLPFKSVHITPAVATQGQTVQVSIETDAEVTLDGAYDGRALVFVGRGGAYRSLIGIPAMASPGPYALDFEAIDGERRVPVHILIQVIEGTFGVQHIGLSAEKTKLLDPNLVAAEAARLAQVTTQATLPGQWQGLFRIPLGGTPTIVSPYGARRSYAGGPLNSYHSGVDYDVPGGTPVLCPAAGRVVLAEPLAVRGNAVIVDHGRGVMSGYWHLSQINVTVGEYVEPGDVLGLVGTTGLSTGDHLHWEIRVMGIPVDPLQWLQELMQ